MTKIRQTTYNYSSINKTPTHFGDTDANNDPRPVASFTTTPKVKRLVCNERPPTQKTDVGIFLLIYFFIYIFRIKYKKYYLSTAFV